MSRPTALPGPPPYGMRPAVRGALARVLVALLAVLAALVLADLAGQASSPLLGGALVLGLGAAALGAYALWRDPSFGIILWLAASLISTTYSGSGLLAVDRLAFVAVFAAWLAEVASGRRPLGRFGLIELLMLAFLVVNVASALSSHALPAISADIPPRFAQPISMFQTIQTEVFFPFFLFVLGRHLLIERARVLRYMWFLTAVGIYLGLTNIFTELGPNSLVFPRDILDPNAGLVTPGQGRARGIFLNGAPTGAALALSMVVAIWLATQPEVRGRRLAALSVPVMLVGIFFTHTRAPIVSGLVVIVFCAIFWTGSRRTFALVLAAIAVLALANLGNLESSDRARGGVGSSQEVDDRLNIAATGFWGLEREPVLGWGLGRYGILNTWYHRAWGGVDWTRGYGDIGHDTELAIAVELGLVGLAVWLAILVAVVVGSRRAWRALPRSGILSRRLVLAFWCAALAWFINESFIDMRLFSYVNAVIFAWAGMVIGLADQRTAEAPAAATPTPPVPLAAGSPP